MHLSKYPFLKNIVKMLHLKRKKIRSVIPLKTLVEVDIKMRKEKKSIPFTPVIISLNDECFSLNG